MAVDFAQLPNEVAVPADKPRFWLWMSVFAVLTLGGVATVLLMWSADMPTQTPQFWITLIGFPTGLAALVVLRRYAMHEGAVLDALAHNEVCQQYRAQVFDYASQPLALIDTAYCLSGDEQQNREAIAAMANGSLELKLNTPLIPGAQAVKARWLEMPDVHLHTGYAANDRQRQHATLGWLFARLLQGLNTRLQALPARVPLSVQLNVACALPAETVTALWQTAWDARALRAADVDHVAAAADLMTLDDWLDHALQAEYQEARLMVTVQLRALLDTPPSEGAAEAGAAVLLMPEALAYQYRIAANRYLHRPERARHQEVRESLAHALQWARLEGKSLRQIWCAGLDPGQYHQWSVPASQLGVDANDVLLDASVGDTGIAAPWLALACAHAAAVDGGARLLLCAQEHTVDCAVLRGPPQSNAAASATAT
ncbi:hypothetical protein F506_18415 [Herbaspirillum hiltneri N3]|uniref:Uncharacterized protein n=1 Tax=Herbaspirillum hiltneri N3 TaxID=1262470 RepID=A0ABN4I0A7_9BURK|nr:hypothetical protein [Herbaspirillum hiltneri]AKZ64369.1 hypothetical protein F506_18415 [Herbaspirillum hiltneri N3]